MQLARRESQWLLGPVNLAVTSMPTVIGPRRPRLGYCAMFVGWPV
jgi:hypothetical protein